MSIVAIRRLRLEVTSQSLCNMDVQFARIPLRGIAEFIANGAVMIGGGRQSEIMGENQQVGALNCGFSYDYFDMVDYSSDGSSGPEHEVRPAPRCIIIAAVQTIVSRRYFLVGPSAGSKAARQDGNAHYSGYRSTNWDCDPTLTG